MCLKYEGPFEGTSFIHLITSGLLSGVLLTEEKSRLLIHMKK